MFSHFVQKLRIVLGFNREGESRHEHEGWHWHLTPAGEAIFANEPPTLRRWLAEFPIVKQNLQRTIVKVDHAGETLYVKLCRANTPRSWARELLRPAKARLEFDNALSLQRLGISAIEPLAWASKSRNWPSDSVIVTRELADAVPLLELLETFLGSAHNSDSPLALRGEGLGVRGDASTISKSFQNDESGSPHPQPLSPEGEREVRQFTLAFAQFLAQHHEAGVTHPDPHPGNFLIADGIHLTDVHALHFGKPLDWPATRDNLTLLNRWFQMRSMPRTRLRFWREYLRHRRSFNSTVTIREWARIVEAATMQSNLTFWRTRMARYTSNNRDSHIIDRGTIAGYATRDLPKDILEQSLNHSDQFFNAAKLKDSRSAMIVIVPRSDGPSLLVKQLRVRSWIVVLKNAFRPSQALRTWRNSNNVRDRGLPTPRVRAMFQRRRFGIPLQGTLIFDYVPDALTLDQAVVNLNDVRQLRAWINSLAQLIRTMHDREVLHRDLKAPNILVAQNMFLLIDLGHATIGKRVTLRQRLDDLTRLNVSFLNGRSTITLSDRLRFLKHYLGKHSEWKRAWRTIATLTRVKIERNIRRRRPLH